MARKYVSESGAARPDQPWYKAKVGEPAHVGVISVVDALLKRAKNRHSKNRTRERIYEGVELARHHEAIRHLETNYQLGLARLNVLKSIVDTFASRLSKDRPLPNFVVDDAEWDLKQKAKEYRKFIVGKMRETEFDDLSTDGLLDGAILGSAFTFIGDSQDDVYAERVHVNEMLFDDRECKYGRPQNGYRVHRVARDWLAEMYPKHRAAIEHADPSRERPEDRGDGIETGSLEDYVDVFSAWHLPTSAEHEDGRHITCVHGAMLTSERWHEPRFPWAMLRLFKPRRGLWGHGFVDQLADLQDRVDKIVADLQMNLAATGRGHFLVNAQNDVEADLLNSWKPFKLKFKGGTPPTWNAPTPFSPAQLQALEMFIEKMYDLSGVSRASAESRSSLGAGASGIALDTQYDIDSDRFRLPQANYARYRLDAGQRYVDGACRVSRRRASASGEKRSFSATTWTSRDAIERLEYDKVKLEEGSYVLQIEAVNFLPDTRAGKLAVVEQLGKAGVIPQWIIPSLFDEPDIVQANRITLSPYRNALRKMDVLAKRNKMIPAPEPMNDLELELKITIGFYNSLQCEDAPEWIQDRFRQYHDLLVAAIALKTKPDPNAPPMPPMSPAELPMPGGVPLMPTGPVPAPTPIGAV